MLGEKLRGIRKARGLSQAKLGELAGVAGPTIARYEKNQIEPSADILMKIAQALDVPISRLLDTGLSEEENAATDIAATMSVKILNDQTLQRIARLLNAMNAEQLDKVASMLEILFNDLKDQHQCLGGAERKPLHD